MLVNESVNLKFDDIFIHLYQLTLSYISCAILLLNADLFESMSKRWIEYTSWENKIVITAYGI